MINIIIIHQAQVLPVRRRKLFPNRPVHIITSFPRLIHAIVRLLTTLHHRARRLRKPLLLKLLLISLQMLLHVLQLRRFSSLQFLKLLLRTLLPDFLSILILGGIQFGNDSRLIVGLIVRFEAAIVIVIFDFIVIVALLAGNRLYLIQRFLQSYSLLE